ncbi:MAG: glycosyltransferase family 2 protein [Planctomycetota bacterium]
MRTLIAVPVYNEQRYVASVLEQVLVQLESMAPSCASAVLCIDDGSTDATPMLLSQFPVEVIRHATNRGYGRSMQDAFRWAAVDRFDWVITMDCDEQHEPEEIPAFVRAIAEDDADVISGSRYLDESDAGCRPPADRRAINQTITAELNERLGLGLTDGFCGFKAYRVEAVNKLLLCEDGYAFPMQFWVQAVASGLRIKEHPIKLIYNDLSRTFGGPLDVAESRLAHYRRVLHAELDRCADRLPEGATGELVATAADGCQGR